MEEIAQPIQAEEATVDIVKEGIKFYEKVEIDIDNKISSQQVIVDSLTDQLQKAVNTLNELRSIK